MNIKNTLNDFINLTTPLLILVLILILSITITAFCIERDFAKEEKIGRKLADRIEKRSNLIEDNENLRRVQLIGENLKKVSGIEEINYQFNIIDRDGPNAFAFPGGFIYLTADLFDYIHSDDELAAVIAHEMGHIIHQHSIKQMQDNRKMKFVELLAVLLTGDPTIGLLGELTTITVLNKYRREYEEEADLTALQLLTKSPDYHPVALLTYFERISSKYILRTSRDLGIFQTHPDLNYRIKKVKQYLNNNNIKIDRRLTTDYIDIEGVIKIKRDLIVSQIFINNEEILKFSGKDRILVYEKMNEIIRELDKTIKLDLQPYEIVVNSEKGESKLMIADNLIISLSNKEIEFQNLSADDILQKTKKRISDILWRLKLQLPILFIK